MLIQLENTTKKLCVIGDPVLHSKSPLLHNAMLSALGLDYVYLCQPVTQKELPRFLAAAQTMGYGGFNATMPHKEALVPLMDVLNPDAQRCGAVNTVCIQSGKLYGYSTDGQGFLRSLQEEGVSVEGKRVVLLGAGGAAKAVALSLVQAGAARLIVCNRTAKNAQAICEATGVMSTSGIDTASLCRVCAEADLLVNCTSLGMAGTGGQFEDLSFLEALPQGAFVADLIYHPAETALLRQARALGHGGVNGLGMLIHQAILALEHFTGLPLDAKTLSAVAKQALFRGESVE